MNLNNKAKGYMLATVAAATYGMNPLFALPLYKNGMNPDSVLFFRYLMAIPILGVMLKMRGRNFSVPVSSLLPLVVMGILVAISSLTLFESYNYMNAGIASTILFVYPIMVAVIMAAFFKEKLTFQTIGSIVLALCGIGLLYKNSDGGTLDVTGTLFVFLSALTYSIYIVGINRSSLKEMATLKVTFYVLLFGLSVFIFRFMIGKELNIPSSDQWYLWGNLLSLAVFPTAISFLCTTSAVQYIGSTPTAILGALEPVTAVFFGVVVFNEVLTMRDCAGLLLIITGVMVVVAGSNVAGWLVHLKKLFPRLPFSGRR